MHCWLSWPRGRGASAQMRACLGQARACCTRNEQTLFRLQQSGGECSFLKGWTRCFFHRLLPQRCKRSAAMSERKAVIKNADMSDDMQTDAIDCAVSVRSTCEALRALDRSNSRSVHS